MLIKKVMDIKNQDGCKVCLRTVDGKLIPGVVSGDQLEQWSPVADEAIDPECIFLASAWCDQVSWQLELPNWRWLEAQDYQNWLEAFEAPILGYIDSLWPEGLPPLDKTSLKSCQADCDKVLVLWATTVWQRLATFKVVWLSGAIPVVSQPLRWQLLLIPSLGQQFWPHWWSGCLTTRKLFRICMAGSVAVVA